MGPKQYVFAATQAALYGRVFSLPRKPTPKKGAGTRPDHSAFRLNPLAL
jgi:hypothetical protein